MKRDRIYLLTALLAGSPAIDHVPGNLCYGFPPQPDFLTTDQRGQPRPGPDSAGDACDIGAYEVQ